MKKRIQKYLSGEKEGFSLVELIIVIAIMAILIGVIALAVIPYLARSRESKDLQALGAISSSLASAVANTQATSQTDVDFVYDGTKVASPTTEADKVKNEMVDLMGKGSTKLSSKSATATGVQIRCLYNVKDNKILVYAGSTAGTAVELESNTTGYKTDLTTDAEGKALVVSN